MLTGTQQRLKLYSRVPLNGLVVYCGTIITDEGKERRVNIDFEPFKPINTSLYLCDNKFHTEALDELLEDDDKFGFIVMDGNGSLYGTLQGNNREVLHKFSVDLPKKHGRGGQSALRFARLRMEKRHNYVRKVAELAVQMFITADKPNVSGLVLAGSADFKSELHTSDMFDQRLAWDASDLGCVRVLLLFVGASSSKPWMLATVERLDSIRQSSFLPRHWAQLSWSKKNVSSRSTLTRFRKILESIVLWLWTLSEHSNSGPSKRL
mmetsp:Transcript_30317/g.93782  ORF Transcript_30317/g.93782 Transcript_30317/m.93782 type:complete len:265 (+) Transcript_30317:402-1196(+)